MIPRLLTMPIFNVGLKIFVAGSIALGVSMQAQSQSVKPDMTWMVVDLPPLHNLVNDQPTDGIADVILKLMIDAWPQVNHKTVTVNTARILANLSEGVPMCYTVLLASPQRERIAYLSDMYPSSQMVVVAREQAAKNIKTNERGEVLLGGLFDRTDLQGVLYNKRSYTTLIDTLLELRNPASRITYATPNSG
jgi:uncharacterized protein (TIGR02285 family)